MKFSLDKKYFKISLYVFLTVAALMIFYMLLNSSQNLWESVGGGLRFVANMLTPFFIGLVIAYILRPAVQVTENLLKKIWKKNKRRRARQLVSIGIIFIILLSLLVVAIRFIIPGLASNISDFIKVLPTYIKQATAYFNEVIEPNPIYNNEIVQQSIDNAINSVRESINVVALSAVGWLANGIVSFVNGVVKVLLGLVLSFYLLSERRSIGSSFSRVVYAKFGEQRSRKISSFFGAVDRVFGKYISSKLVESMIVFAMAQLVFILLAVPYSTLMSTIVALTNMVPYIGPLIGGMVPVLVTLLEYPVSAIYVALAIVVLQVLDAYFIQPKLIGDKMGLNPFWVLLSVIMGGALYGVIGILLAVPVAAVIKIIIRYYIKTRANRLRNHANKEDVMFDDGLR